MYTEKEKTKKKILKEDRLEISPVVQWLRLYFSMQRVRIRSLSGELRSQMLQSVAKNLKIRDIF